ncbi:chloroplast-targeted copper chaperone, putative [Ricinus communis]|uniref:Chloroplast-targeted copper chaperone, putative n=1 Tax=Ricinus communis TaxID=3988 RepID=B9SYJ7_RICCO|nr:chloroplast-targeted copper chaperone, putative [Ricinus communis]|eukprot:XP_002531066.1 heavy metal-associated isoprenylated plant protein 37 [Ricinus communis]
MTKEEDFKLLKIQTCVLKVNIHCDGCKQKVKKLLQRIEGVYQVSIEAEQQKVTISGSVDSATLIKKLVRAGKHAEVWSQKSNQNQNQKNDCIKDDKNNKGQKQGIIKGLEAFKNQQKFPAFSSEDDDDFFDDDDDEEDEEDELRFLRPRQLGLFRQQVDGNNAKKNAAATAAAGPNHGGNKMNNNVGNGNGQKKGNPNQNMGMKVNPGGVIDQKAMAALKMNNASLRGGNINPGEAGRRGNDIAAMMNLAGFHGNSANVANSAAGGGLGGNPNGLGGFQQVQSNTGYQGSSAAGFPTGGFTTGQYPSTMLMNMNGYNHPAANMMMNMQNRHAMPQQQQHQQPQMMYHRSPFIPPNTGYYYNYSPAPYPSYTEQPTNHNGDNSTATTHMFSDENTGSCSIM